MIDTHFTRQFGLLHPFALAPSSPLSDGRLAAAVSRAGGLGLIHVGAQSAPALADQFRATGEDAVGWGIDMARLDADPAVLDQLLGYRPRAILLSGGGATADYDPRPYAARIKQAGVRMITVVQSAGMARAAIAAGTDVLVARGTGATGPDHSTRSTIALLPEVADAIYAARAETLLLAAGGIADPRGIAASLIMGADGVMLGTRFWASQDSALDADQIAEILDLSGDSPALQPELGEAVGLIHDAPGIDSLLPALTTKTSRLMTHIRRKVVE